MAYLFRFDERTRTLQISAAGVISDLSLLEIHDAIERLWPLHNPDSAWFDWSAVTELNVTRATIRALANSPSVIPRSTPRVHLAPHDHAYGLARMFQMMAADMRPNVYVVRNAEEAFRLIGISSPPTLRNALGL